MKKDMIRCGALVFAKREIVKEFTEVGFHRGFMKGAPLSNYVHPVARQALNEVEDDYKK